MNTPTNFHSDNGAHPDIAPLDSAGTLASLPLPGSANLPHPYAGNSFPAENHPDDPQLDGASEDDFGKGADVFDAPRLQAPDCAPPPEFSQFQMPMIEGDISFPVARQLDAAGTQVTHYYAPPAVKEEFEPLATLLDEFGLRAQGADLRMRSKAAEIARQELIDVQKYLGMELKVWNDAGAKHNAEASKWYAYARKLLELYEFAERKAHSAASQSCSQVGVPMSCENFEKALEAQLPPVEAVAGAQGITRLAFSEGSRLFDFAAPVACGFLTLVVGLGPTLNLFKISMLDDLGTYGARLAIGTGLGAFVVSFLGLAVGQGMTHLAMRLQERAPSTIPQQVGRGAKWLIPVAVLGAISLLMLFEVAVGGTGIYITGQEQLAHTLRAAEQAEATRLLSQSSSGEIPRWVCALIAAVINIPYLFYKGLSAWNHVAASLRADWIAHLRNEHLKALRSNDKVVQASHALNILKARREDTKRQREVLQMIEGRFVQPRFELDDASKLRWEMQRVAASGEADRVRSFAREWAKQVGELVAPQLSERRPWWARLRRKNARTGATPATPQTLR